MGVSGKECVDEICHNTRQLQTIQLIWASLGNFLQRIVAEFVAIFRTSDELFYFNSMTFRQKMASFFIEFECNKW
jgi:hypothetical protein